MKKNNHSHYSRGFSQVEIMVTIVVISIVILGIITTFSAIGKGLITGKTRTIANNLAQEKVESLKNFSYSRLLTTSETDLQNYGYDNTNTEYVPETLRIGDASYTRYTTVWKAQESDNEISTMSPTAADEGVKKIKIEIKWTENNEQKSLVLYNLRDDPNRSTMSGNIYGIITSTSGSGISGARVEIVQDVNRNDTTSTTGYYIIKTTSPATFQVRSSKDGYWSKVSANTAVSSAVNLQLTAKETGSASGFVHKRDHLVISEVCAALTDDTTEYVELYNPTTSQLQVGVGMNMQRFKLKYVNDANACSDFPALTSNPVIDMAVPSHGYVLIASQKAVNGKAADFYYSAGGQDIIKVDVPGGIGLLSAGSEMGGFDVWIDSVAWAKTATQAPGNALEDSGALGKGVDLAAGSGAQGFAAGESIERVAYSTYTAADMNGSTNANAYDSNQNFSNFVHHTALTDPQNSGDSETPVLGMPVAQAIVSANDGLSNTTTTDATGYYYLTGIATGTVTIYASSLTLSGLVPNNNIITGGNTRCDVVLSSTSDGGFISGYVKSGVSPFAAIANIIVSAGGYSSITDSNGYYSLAVGVGSYTVIANPDYSSSPDGADWTSGTSEDAANEPVEVNLGVSVLVDDLILFPAGWISGNTYNASGGILPYITIRTTSAASGFSKDVVSGSDGQYMIKGAKTANDYDLYPVLDESDTYSKDGGWTTPVTVSAGVEATSKNFRITSAWGKINGIVSDTAAGGNITTGVLIVATTASMPADDPVTIDSAFRSGSTIYYGTNSTSDGTYEISVRKGNSYNLKAWYTKILGTGVAVQPTKTGTANFGVNDSSATVSFTWP